MHQLDGESIRYELMAFAKTIRNSKQDITLGRLVTMAITDVIECYYSKIDYLELRWRIP